MRGQSLTSKAWQQRAPTWYSIAHCTAVKNGPHACAGNVEARAPFASLPLHAVRMTMVVRKAHAVTLLSILELEISVSACLHFWDGLAGDVKTSTSINGAPPCCATPSSERAPISVITRSQLQHLLSDVLGGYFDLCATCRSKLIALNQLASGSVEFGLDSALLACLTSIGSP